MTSKVLSFLSLLLLATAAAAGPVQITGSRDITKVLGQFPNFSTLNKLLTQTKVADQINSRQTITVFAVADSAMSSVTSLPADVLQKVLSLHVVLDYFDIDKISNLHDATALLPTLFQASGNAVGKSGFINATDVGDGQVKLGSAVDSSLTSDVIRGIAMQPYNISVIEISQVIVPPGIASSSSSSSSSSTATPTPAPKASPAAPKAAPAVPAPKASPAAPKATPAVPAPKASPAAPKAAPAAPQEAPVSPKAAPAPKASAPSSNGDSSKDSPAPATDAPVSSPPQASSTAPSAEAPGESADAPAGPADAPTDSADAPVGSADVPVGSADVPAGSANAPTADAPTGVADKASSASRLVAGMAIGAAMGTAFLAAL